MKTIKTKTIKVDEQVYARVVALRGKLETKTGKIVSLNKVIKRLLDSDIVLNEKG